MKRKLRINGMHCQGCVNTVKKSLESVEEVKQAIVLLTTESAEVETIGDTFPFEKIEKAVEDAGYSIEDSQTDALTLQISGMTCTGCSSTVEKAIKQTTGVVDVNVNLMAEKAYIEYDPNQANIEEIIKNVEASGYQAFLEKPASNKLQKKRERDEKKVKAAKLNMVYSWVITIPLMIWMFIDMTLGMHFTSHLVMEAVMVTGAGIVLFWPGLQTLKSAFLSAKNLIDRKSVV